MGQARQSQEIPLLTQIFSHMKMAFKDILVYLKANILTFKRLVMKLMMNIYILKAPNKPKKLVQEQAVIPSL